MRPGGSESGTDAEASGDGRIVSCVRRDSFDPFRPFPAPGVSENDFVSALGLAKRLNPFRPFRAPGVSEPDFVSALGLAKRLNFFRLFPAPGVSEPDFVSALGLAKRNFRFLHPHPRTSSGTVFVFPLGKSNT